MITFKEDPTEAANKELFNSLGYDTSLKGYKYFNCLLEETRDEAYGSKEELTKFLDSCCVEYGHFYYECGIKSFKKELVNFIDSKVTNEDNATMTKQIFGDLESKDVADTVVGINNYLNSFKKSSTIVYQKCKTIQTA